MLLKAALRAPAQPPQQREPALPGAEQQERPRPPPLPGAEEQELPLLPVLPLQGVRWPEPQKGELPATKKGEEVWRPPTPAGTVPTEGVSLGAVSTSADSMASSSLATGSIAARGPTEVSLPSPRLCSGLLGV
ncbi:UNVERIFIED_CONTAM: hypothetical protein FKN15_005085 [Acipenser sinensis]